MVRHRPLIPLPCLFVAVVWWGTWAFGEGWPTREPKGPSIPQREFRITDYGAKGDGTTLNTAALQRAVAACAAAGGGRVVVPQGKFLTGAFELASHTALVLEKDAVLQASDHFADFGLPDPLPDTQAERNALAKSLRVLVEARNLTDVAILGEGTIDGAGAIWWANSDKASERAPLPKEETTPDGKKKPVPPLYVPRPNLVVFRDCERVKVQGVTLANSPMFHLVPHLCREVWIEDVKIHSPADSPNTDGIDPANSRHVLIRHCTIDCGDDNIALKAGSGSREATEDVVVTDCDFHHGHGVSIGSETGAGVRRFLVERCRFEGTDNGLRIKSDRNRGGPIERVMFRDIQMKNVGLPLTVFLYYDNKQSAKNPEMKPVTEDTPKLRDIVFSRIECEGATYRAGEIIGLPESPVTDVKLEHVHITRAAAPFTFTDVKALEMTDVDVQVAPGLPAPH